VKIRVVFDTNVYVAAALRPGGASDIWLDIAAKPGSQFELFASEAILAKVSEKLSDKFNYHEAEAADFVRRIAHSAQIVEPSERLIVIHSDPDDDMVLECAMAAKAHLIVSADHHLLNLREFRGIGVCHPKDLKNIFRHDLDKAR
jgi:putative PIN family toxin of toxin-antitoxin system